MQALLIIALFTQPPHQTNPVKIVTTATFDLYRALISHSQGDVCNFSPSCSHFATEAIEEYGIIWGSFMATDRLLRCNPWAYESFNKYYVGMKNRKIHDPIENNYIFRKIRKESTRHTR
jgi:putative membrane protein insertion efficiency factor